jgi:ATP synthase protein I
MVDDYFLIGSFDSGAGEMKQETRQTFRDLGYYSGLGLSVALSIMIGFFIGYLLDRWLGTTPWGMFVFLILGIAAGFRNILLAMKRSKNI